MNENEVLANALLGAEVIGVGGIPDLKNAKEMYLDLELRVKVEGKKVHYRVFTTKIEPLGGNNEAIKHG